MRLFGSLTSPYVRKIRVLLEEKNLACEFVREVPREPTSQAQARNPLGKIPVLHTDAGFDLYDSVVIAAYLDTLSTPRLIPDDASRWPVLRLEATADGLCDAIVTWMMEGKRPEAQRSSEVIAWEARRIDRACAHLDTVAGTKTFLVGETLSLADIAVACALDYCDFRFQGGWHQRHPGLAAWRDGLVARASFRSQPIVAG